MKYTDSETMEKKEKHFKNIGIIAYASAISGAYSLIESVSMNYDNSTALTLLWMGDKQSDFLFLEELMSIAKLGKLNLNLMLTEFEKDWLGPYGKVLDQHVSDYMPPPL
jgi:NAD(P)H-flavin reductase